ncbi:MAG: hypothetical protein ACOYL6_14365 [Bacteriovoracaceae bacterium]
MKAIIVGLIILSSLNAFAGEDYENGLNAQAIAQNKKIIDGYQVLLEQQTGSKCNFKDSDSAWGLPGQDFYPVRTYNCGNKKMKLTFECSSDFLEKCSIHKIVIK